MKKSLLALAVLGAFVGVASAQSSVTLYGTIDLNARYVKNDGSTRRLSLGQDGLNSSQLGFRGVEDLGGGLKAGFTLLSGVNADTGSTNAQFFNRRSTVSLMGGFGEVRLGRDYVPTYWNQSLFTPFGITAGLGSPVTAKQMYAPDHSRSNNAIQFLLPTNIGGAYGQVMAAAGEGTGAGRYIGGRFGFATGPFDIAVAYSEERLGGLVPNGADVASNVARAGFSASGSPLASISGKYKTYNVGGSFDFGVVKLMGFWNQEKQNFLSGKNDLFSLGASVPMGQGEIHLAGEHSKLKTNNFNNTVNKYEVGYVYNLSKRTAVYGNVAYLNNGGRSALTLGSAGTNGNFSADSGSATLLPTVGGNSKGAEVGIRHFF